MTKILVVGLAVILAAAGSVSADGTGSTSSQGGASSATTGSAHSSGSGAARSSGSGTVQQGAVAPARSSGSNVAYPAAVVPAPSSRVGGAPVVRQYPANVNVQNRVPVYVNPNALLPRPLERSELLARQSLYHRNWLSLATIQGVTPGTANTGQLRRGGQVETSSQSDLRVRNHGESRDGPQNTTNAINRTNGPIQATNSGLHTGKPVLNFNNSNTMNFTDACRRHRGSHDCNWWRNHCTTIILIGGGFYAWDLGYWYPAYGYDPNYSNYAYDGPIYGYDGLPPDQIIANVQYALQQLGYFSEAVDGVLGEVTRAAIEDYQVENNLPVTGAIDRPLLVSLGFIY